MKINKVSNVIKCDTVLCNQNAIYKIETNSYKGHTFLCEQCFSELKKILANKDKIKNGK